MQFIHSIQRLAFAGLAGAALAAVALAPATSLARTGRVAVAPAPIRPATTVRRPVKLIAPAPIRTARANNVNRPRYQAAPVTRATPLVHRTPSHS